MPHALTIDVEDWAALMCMYAGHCVPAGTQFVESTERVLAQLDELHVKGTFFVVARHGAEQPAVVRTIVERGHELGSHAWTHRLVRACSPNDFGQDLRRSVSTLEDLTGRQIHGHRSPLYSLMPEHVWALEAMAEAGLEYDSSIFTLAWHRAGLMIPEQPFLFRLPSGREIVEFPAPAKKWGPLTVRFIGGRGARLAPARLFVRHLEARQGAGLPGMVYVHSYEMTSESLASRLPSSLGLKRIPMALAGLAFQVGRGRLQQLLCRLLEQFEWATMREVIGRLRDEARLPLFDLSSPEA